jgi:DNA-binding transcriptional LysR family regulator
LIIFNPWLKMVRMVQTLSTIESFVRSAESGSFSAAARKLGISPAAVSKSVARLEAAAGVRLFHRTTRSLTLTEAGARFLRQAASGLATLEAAMTGLASRREEPAGVLRVNLSPAIGRDYVLPMAGPFLARHPAITLDWQFENRQVDLVAEGVDAAIGASLELRAGVVARELSRAHFVAVASKAYLARHGTPKVPADLVDHDGILLRSPTTGRLRTFSFRSTSGEVATLEPRPRILFNDSEAMRDAALAGYGIALVGMPNVMRHLQHGELVRVLPKWHADAGAISVYYGSKRLLPAKTRAFVDALVAHFKRERLAQRFDAS